MKLPWSTYPFATAAAMVVAVNAVLIALVAYNRSGPPESLLALGSRELTLPSATLPLPVATPIADEDLPELLPRWRLVSGDESGPSVYATSDRSGGPIEADAPAWLDEAKLRELGARLPAAGPEGQLQRRRLAALPLTLEALLVLEIDGDAYRLSLERARARAAKAAADLAADAQDAKRQREASNADKALADEEHKASRLFVVDAGRDAAALRARYPARDRCAIVPGRIMVTIAGPEGQERVFARVVGTNADRVSVPAAFRAALERLGSDASGAAGTVDLAFGRRLEPWVRGVSAPP